jgi:hypothetical protein
VDDESDLISRGLHGIMGLFEKADIQKGVGFFISKGYRLNI